MLEMLVLVAIVVPVLAVVYVVMKWAARLEERALRRQEMRRVYYPRRGRKAGVKEFKRRSEPECEEASGWCDDTAAP